MGNLGNLGNLGDLGDLGDLGIFGTLGNLGNLGNVGNLVNWNNQEGGPLWKWNFQVTKLLLNGCCPILQQQKKTKTGNLGSLG